MAKRKQSATQKLRKLVQQQVRRMEKRGYRIGSEIKEKIKTGKYQTLKSLQRNKYEKLYKQSSSEIEGKIVGGEQKRTYERRESARRASETRRYRRQLREREQRPYREQYDDAWEDYDYGQTYEESEDEDYYIEWKRERRRQDEQDRREADLYSEGEIVYNQIKELIDKFPTDGSRYLSNVLRSEISRFGESKVIEAIGTAPEFFIQNAQVVFYDSDSNADNIHTALRQIAELITGTIVNASDSKAMGETMDQMTDMSPL